MKELKGACIIGQSGGPTSVINASAYGVIDTALKSGVITQVLGAEHGIKGVLSDRLFDMGLEDPEELRLLKYIIDIVVEQQLQIILPVHHCHTQLLHFSRTSIGTRKSVQRIFFPGNNGRPPWRRG